jgi:small-conductance mechanosensitive channel
MANSDTNQHGPATVPEGSDRKRVGRTAAVVLSGGGRAGLLFDPETFAVGGIGGWRRMAEESHEERVNRDLEQMLQELRVVLPGVQVLLAFLLTAPFQQRFAELLPNVRNVYFAAVCCAVMAVALLIAPSAHHRLTFRREEKERLLITGNRLAVIGTMFLAAAIVLAFYVVAHALFGAGQALASALVAAVVFATVWYLLPFTRRLASGRDEAPSGSRSVR